MNSGKAMVVCSPVTAAADRYGPLPFGFQRGDGHRERPFKQGRAFRVWNGGAYKSQGARTQGSGVSFSKLTLYRNIKTFMD